MESNGRDSRQMGVMPQMHECNDIERTEDTTTEMSMDDFTMNWMSSHIDSPEEQSEGWEGSIDAKVRSGMMHENMEEMMESESANRDSRSKNTSGGY